MPHALSGITSSLRSRKKKGNDVSVASSGEGDYTSGGTAEVGPSGERGIIHVEYVVCFQIPISSSEKYELHFCV